MSPKTLTLAQALQLLSLPREIGPDVDGNTIRAALGRFGPYLIKEIPGAEKPDYRNLKLEEQLFTTTLEEARAIYAQPKRSRGSRGAPPPLRELGPDPATMLGMSVRDGKYGMYLSDGETHVTLPRDMKPEELKVEDAVRMLAEKRESGPAKKKSSRRRKAG
jgi:DNA topoisomerase-1